MRDGHDGVLQTTPTPKNIVTIVTTVTEAERSFYETDNYNDSGTTVSVGATFLFLSRLFARRTRKPCMTFAELYNDNICDGIGGLFN